LPALYNTHNDTPRPLTPAEQAALRRQIDDELLQDTRCQVIEESATLDLHQVCALLLSALLIGGGTVLGCLWGARWGLGGVTLGLLVGLGGLAWARP